MNRQHLLLQIEKQLQQLKTLATNGRSDKVDPRSFDRQLFTCSSGSLQDYLAELQQHHILLLQEQDVARAAWLAEKVINQLTAIQRLLTTQPARGSKPAAAPDALEQHEEFARRLQAMIDTRETLMSQAETLVQQQQLKQELEALESRLQRCMVVLNRLRAGLSATR